MSAAIAGAFAIVGCSSSAASPSAVTSLTISGTAPTVGKTSQYTAGVVLANSSTTLDVTTAVSWTIDKPTVATISAAGVVTGVSTRTAILTATYQGTTVSQQVTVS